MARPPKGDIETGLSAGAVLARETTRNVCLFGVLALVIGGIVAGACYPHDTTDAPAQQLFDGSILPPSVSHHGSQGGFAAGLVVLGIGQMLLLIALIAWGVRLGVTSAERYRAPVAPLWASDAPTIHGENVVRREGTPQHYQEPPDASQA